MKYFNKYIKFFVVLFIIMLCIPMLSINREENSDFEKRYLAKFPNIRNENRSLNYDFGKQFENYFGDRFFLRKKFVQLYCDIKFYLSSDYYHFEDIIFNKKNHYATLKNFKDYYDISDAEKKLIIRNVGLLKRFCDKNNIKLYVAIAPSKNEVGSTEAYPAPLQQKTYNHTKVIINNIKSDTGVDILYPHKELVNLEKSGEPAYFKMDDHWTDMASYVTYLRLMENIKKDFKNVKVTKLEDFDKSKSNYVRVCPLYGYNKGKYFINLHLRDEKYLDKKYTYLIPKGDIEETHEPHGDKLYNRHFYMNKTNSSAPNVYIYGDSFSQNIIPSVVSSFYKTTSLFNYLLDDKDRKGLLNIEKFEDDILQSKPDILIVIFAAIDKFMYL